VSSYRPAFSESRTAQAENVINCKRETQTEITAAASSEDSQGEADGVAPTDQGLPGMLKLALQAG
jgi:hypothetical protein